MSCMTSSSFGSFFRASDVDRTLCLETQRHHRREGPKATSSDRAQRQDGLSRRQHHVGAVSAYERIKTRYPDAGGEDYLFLPDYPNRATASRIFQRQFNQLMDDRVSNMIPSRRRAQRLLPAPHCDLHAHHPLTRQGQHLQPRQERWHQRQQIERFYAKHLPLSREMAKNLQASGGVAALTSAGPEALVSPVPRRGLELPWASRSSASAGYTKRAATRERRTRENDLQSVVLSIAHFSLAFLTVGCEALICLLSEFERTTS